MGVQLLTRLIRAQRHFAHANQRIARTEIVEKINQLFFAPNHRDRLGLFNEELVGGRGRARAALKSNSALRGLHLDRSQELNGLVFRRDASAFARRVRPLL